MGYLDALSKRVDCRVGDFRGIGFYALYQDGEVFFLLASREGRARIRTSTGYESLGSRYIDGVTALPIETASAQQELFSADLTDFLALYRIDTRALDGPDAVLDIALGGSGEEMDTLLDALDQPGVVENGVPEKNILLNLISDKMMVVRFDGYVPSRELYALDAPRLARKRRPARIGRLAGAVVAVMVVLSMGVVWLSERWSGGGPATTAGTDRIPEPATETAAAPEERAVEEGASPRPSTEAGDIVKFAVKWQKSYGKPVTSSPVVVGDRVIFGGRDGKLYALHSATGDVLWRHDAADGIGASPVVGGNSVIAADYQGNVVAVDFDGDRLWQRKLPGKVVSTPCVGEGEVVVGCYDGIAYALSVETGRVLWKVRTGARIRGSAAFADKQFYVPSYDGKLYAVTSGTGAVRWTFGLGGQVSSSPATDGALVAVGGGDGYVYAVDAGTGRQLWRYKTAGPVMSAVALADGKVLAGSNDKSLYCLDAASGELVWQSRTGGSVLGRPVLYQGHVLFASYDKSLYSLDAETGERVDRFETDGGVYSSPAIGGDNVYFGNNNGKFYCVDLRGSEAL